MNDLPRPRRIREIWAEVIADVKRLGPAEAFGLQPIKPWQVINPQTCHCGGGCESLLECRFWYYVRKTELMERKAERHARIGRYFVDSIFDCDGKLVAVELDGKQYHDAERDHRRDAVILHSIDAIIRIPFASMHWYPEATMQVLGSWFPRFLHRNGLSPYCFTPAEFEGQRQLARESACWENDAEFLEYADRHYEIWSVAEDYGIACSAKAWLCNWKVAPITLRRRVA